MITMSENQKLVWAATYGAAIAQGSTAYSARLAARNALYELIEYKKSRLVEVIEPEYNEGRMILCPETFDDYMADFTYQNDRNPD